MSIAYRVKPRFLVAVGLAGMALLVGVGIRRRESYCRDCAVTRAGFALALPGMASEIRLGGAKRWASGEGGISVLLAGLLGRSECTHRWVRVSDQSVLGGWLDRRVGTLREGKYQIQQRLLRGQLPEYTQIVAVLARHDPQLAVAVARSLIRPPSSAGECALALRTADEAWTMLLEEGPANAIPELRRRYSVGAAGVSPEAPIEAGAE